MKRREEIDSVGNVLHLPAKLTVSNVWHKEKKIMHQVLLSCLVLCRTLKTYGHLKSLQLPNLHVLGLWEETRMCAEKGSS